jgi:hypothetical protein
LIYDPVENRGRHTHRGSHYSYDSRRKYLSDAYLEKSSILEEKAQKHNSRESDGHKQYPLFKRGEIIQQKQDRGSNPKESSSKGISPKRRMALFHLCQRGRNRHIDVIDV